MMHLGTPVSTSVRTAKLCMLDRPNLEGLSAYPNPSVEHRVGTGAMEPDL